MKPLKEFWITINNNDKPSHIALHEKYDDRKSLHVREVDPTYDAAIAGLVEEFTSLYDGLVEHYNKQNCPACQNTLNHADKALTACEAVVKR